MNSRELAKIAGVSQTTVSRCLNDSPLVKEETKKMVKALAKKYNFGLNASARSLRLNRMGTVGLVFPKHFVDFSENMYYGDLFNMIRSSLDRRGYDLIALTHNKSAQGISSIERVVRNGKIDALIVFNAYGRTGSLPIEDVGLPCVFIDDEHTEDARSMVTIDHYYGGLLAGERFALTGRKKIASIMVVPTCLATIKRTRGFQDALLQYGLHVETGRILSTEIGYDWGVQCVKAHFETLSSCDGIFVQNDITAIGVMHGLIEAGCRVPEDIAVIGYSDIHVGAWCQPPLTTLRMPIDDIAEYTSSTIYNILENSIADFPVMNTKPYLLVRASG